MLNETSELYQYYSNDLDIINEVKKSSDDMYSFNVYSESFMTSSEVYDMGEYYGFEVEKEDNKERPNGIYWAVEDLLEGIDEHKDKRIKVVGIYTHRV